MRWALGIFLGLIGVLPAAAAGPAVAIYTQSQGNAMVAITGDKLAEGRLHVALSTSPVVTITIRGKPPIEIDGGQRKFEDDLVFRLTDSGAFQTLQPTPVKRTMVDGNEVWELSYKVDPRATAIKERKYVHNIHLKEFTYRDGSGASHRVSWQPISIQLTTMVENPETASPDQARDITGIEAGPAEEMPWYRMLVIPFGIAGIVLLAISALLAVRQLRSKTPRAEAPLPPRPWALRELDRIASQNLPDAGQAGRYHTLVSDVVRRYLEMRFDLPVQKQTTVEFLSSMRTSTLLTMDQQNLMRDLLERCDLAKFAGVQPTVEECRAAGVMARTFIEQT